MAIVDSAYPLQDIARRKALFADIREQAKVDFQAGLSGTEISHFLFEGTSKILLQLLQETMTEIGANPETLAKQGAIVAVGGMGRGELAPFSDIDLLFLREDGQAEFDQLATRFVQICWDSGVKLGHALRDIRTCCEMAKTEPQIATALVEARLFWGDKSILQKLRADFTKKVIQPRRQQFILDCLNARKGGFDAEGPLAQELEPDVKNSSGGLRDLHLIRWIAFAQYGIKDIQELRAHKIIDEEDAVILSNAQEFLTHLRIDLHLSAGRQQDRLTRDEQLRIARERGYEESAEQRAVEKFMRNYFQHSSGVATITQRFATLQKQKSLLTKIRDLVLGHKAEGHLYVTPDQIVMADRHLDSLCVNLETILQAFRLSSKYNLPLSPKILEAIKHAVPTLPSEVSSDSARLFLDIFTQVRSLGMVVRKMFMTGVLDLVIPEVTHIRNLLQFNQYHHFTVDEHTLRAVETVTRFETDESSIGAAYRTIRNKQLLHLAVLLHDIGKGYSREHSEVGEEISIIAGTRLQLPIHHSEQIAMLVRQHLVMADLAWRRDITDPLLVLDFCRKIGSPESLRMLYVLTAADVTSVGPGTWTEWKASLLTELYDSCLVILSGKGFSLYESERIQQVRQEVLKRINENSSREYEASWVHARLEGFSAYYLTTTPSERIVEDLKIIEELSDSQIEVIPLWHSATGATEYRIITKNPEATTGCFYKMCGVLTAKRLSILSADINTTRDGVVVDTYLVIDTDFEGEPPPSRHAEIAKTLREVLVGELTIEKLFVRSRRFGQNRCKTVSNLPNQVKVDNDSSDTRTIIDVFAHDRRGLLYTLARTLFEMQVSIDLAKISTHFDQVVDVFYIQENDGSKISSDERLKQIQDGLKEALEVFDQTGHVQFF